MITELTRTDTDLRRPLTGDSAATSSDGAETDSGSAFAAILAPMSVDGARTAADGQPSRAHAAANTGCAGVSKGRSETSDASPTVQGEDGDGALSIAALHNRPLTTASSGEISPGDGSANRLPKGSSEDAVAEPGFQIAPSQAGNSGKRLPPGGKNAQPLPPAPDGGAAGNRAMADAGSPVDTASDPGEIANVAAAIPGGTTGGPQAPQSAPGTEARQPSASADPGVAVAAGAPRNAGIPGSGAEGASENTLTADAVDGTAMPEGELSERASRTSAEALLLAKSGDGGKQAAPSGGGLLVEDSAQTSALSERGPAAAGAELRSADRPLMDRPGAELTQSDRAYRLPVQQFAGQPGWGEEIQGKLQWLSRQGIHRAELQLHPAELGSIEVRITAEQDQTSVVFVAANRTARELLEAEMPRLRELFSQAGVELGQAEVSDRESGDREFAARDESHDKRHSSTARRGAETAEAPLEDANLLSVGVRGARGMIDYYI